MTLEELVARYQLESYSVFFGKDIKGNIINKWFVFYSHEGYLEKYLRFYKQLSDLTEVIVYATDGFFKISNHGIEFFIRHGHQAEYVDKQGNLKGIKPTILNEVRNNLIRNIDALRSAEEFNQIIDIVNSCKVRGFGELATYDTSLRISSYLDIEPKEVYLHAGSRNGCKALVNKGYLPLGTDALPKVELDLLPTVLQQFKPTYIEHFLCAAKDKLEHIEPLNLLGNYNAK